MMKLNSLVLLVLCGVAVSQASALDLTVGSCPKLLHGLVGKCGLNALLSLSGPLDCSSSALQCLAERLFEDLGLDVSDTQFNSTAYVDALVGLGVPVANVNTCLAEVKGLVTGKVDLLGCHVALDGQLVLCLLQKLGCLVSLNV